MDMFVELELESKKVDEIITQDNDDEYVGMDDDEVISMDDEVVSMDDDEIMMVDEDATMVEGDTVGETDTEVAWVEVDGDVDPGAVDAAVVDMAKSTLSGLLKQWKRRSLTSGNS
jgi:hypothetical protein